ncbi:MAG: hypothetical protein QXL02_01860 [Candidatus Anstonellales archaeon]
MTTFKEILNAYKKEGKSTEYVIEKLLKNSDKYEIYLSKHEQILNLQNNLPNIISSRKNLNSYLRSLSFEDMIKITHYLGLKHNVRFYRLNHYNDFVLEGFGLLKIRDNNLINFHRAIDRIARHEDFEPPEIDSIGKHNSLFYHAIKYGNMYVLDRLIARENNYYHHGLSMNYYLWEHGLLDRFMDSLKFQSVYSPQFSYVNDETYSIIHVICLDDILYLDIDRLLINRISQDYLHRFIRFSPSEILKRDRDLLIDAIERIKLLVVMGSEDGFQIYKNILSYSSSLELDQKVFEF